MQATGDSMTALILLATPALARTAPEPSDVALRDLTPRIEIDEELRVKAKKSLDAMLAMASATVGQGDLGPARVTGD